MALPPKFDTVQVRGKYVDLGGTPVVGRVIFTPTPAAMTDVGDLTIIINKPLQVTLASDGTFAVQLPATDDPDIEPTGFSYQVTEDFVGVSGRSYSIRVPIAYKTTGIDLAGYGASLSSAGSPYIDGGSPDPAQSITFDALVDGGSADSTYDAFVNGGTP